MVLYKLPVSEYLMFFSYIVHILSIYRLKHTFYHIITFPLSLIYMVTYMSFMYIHINFCDNRLLPIQFISAGSMKFQLNNGGEAFLRTENQYSKSHISHCTEPRKNSLQTLSPSFTLYTMPQSGNIC